MEKFSANGHVFSFQESSLTYRDPHGRDSFFPFDQKLRISVATWSSKISIHGPQGKAPLYVLPENLQREFLLDFFQRWKRSNQENAKKAAFDYVEGQRSFVPIALVLSAFFALPVSIALLNDSREQAYCTTVLRENSAVGEMQVTKFRKKRKGHYILTLEFTTPQGAKIEGKDQIIISGDSNSENIEAKIPKSVPVVYSPEHPECWSLTPNLSGTEVNWAKRRFFTAFTLLFGAFFLATAVFGFLWAIARKRQERPLAQEIRNLFSL